MSAPAQLLDQHGRPLAPSAPRARGLRGYIGGDASVFPYDAGSWTSQELGSWFPWIHSPDYEINPHRDRMVARERDLVRNDGWASGAVRGILDETVGHHLHLVAKPDYRALAEITGLATFDAKWASQYGAEVEARWRTWSNDPGRYNDVARQLTTSQQFRLGLRHKLIDGENLMVLYTMPERIAASGFATAALGLDPDLLSNPYDLVDQKHLRGGVEIDANGVPLAVHIRKAHQYDWYNAAESVEWERVTCEIDGWQRVIHDFERDRFNQHRGVSIFAPVLARLRMLTKYDAAELQAALINAILSTFITSPYDPQMVRDALQGDEVEELRGYQGLRADFHRHNAIMMNGNRIPVLVPGEKVESVSANRPGQNFDSFEHAMLRHTAAQTGQSAEQVSKDWSKTNYSSARGALNEAFKTVKRRLGEFTLQTASPLYTSWLDEGHDHGYFTLPKGAPEFRSCRAAYARCRWLGPGRGFVDPVKEKQGSILGLDAGLSTLEQECADLTGTDWRENLEQRAIEVARFKALGLALPEWGGQEMATLTDEKPRAA